MLPILIDLKGRYEGKLKFPLEGGGISNQNPSMGGGVWVFPGTTQLTSMIMLFKSDTATTDTVGKMVYIIRANLRKKGYNSETENEAGVLKAALKFTYK